MCPAMRFEALSGGLNALLRPGVSVNTIPAIFSGGTLKQGVPIRSPGRTSGIGLRFGGGSSP